MLEVREGVPVLENNSVYKGYRLTAKVVRGTSPSASGPIFTATVVVLRADSVHDDGDEYPVPCFVSGASVYSPREAVHAAVLHGREIVEGLIGQARSA